MSGAGALRPVLRPAAGASGGVLRSRSVAILAGQIGVLVVWFAAWEFVGRQQPAFLSYPSQIASAVGRMLTSNQLLDLISFTGKNFVVGWSIAVVLGVLAGTAVGWFRPVALMFEPFINAIYATPKLVFIPLMILWFGLGPPAYVASIVIGTIFPMLIMTMTGVRNAGREYVEVARAYRVKGLPLFYKVVLPGALPFMMVGLRLSMGRAIGGAIAAEFYLGGSGVGAAVLAAGLALSSARMYAFILFIAGSAMLVDFVLRRVWNVLSPTRT